MQGIVFDLDGTLIESLEMWQELDTNFLAKFGIEYTDDLKAKVSGFTLEKAAKYFKERFKLALPVDKIVNMWNNQLIFEYKNNILLKNGALEYINSNYEKGIKMGIATLSEDYLCEIILNKFNLKDKISYVITGAQKNFTKDKPDIYLDCAKNIGVEPSECVVFEDSVIGLESAGKVGFYTVGMLTKDEELNKGIIHNSKVQIKDFKDNEVLKEL